LQHPTLDFLAISVSTPGICAPTNPIIDTAIENMVQTLSLDSKSEAVKSVTWAIKEKVHPIHENSSLPGILDGDDCCFQRLHNSISQWHETQGAGNI
jgi:hypothetical protein